MAPPGQWGWVGTKLTGSGTSHLWQPCRDHSTSQASTGACCSQGTRGQVVATLNTVVCPESTISAEEAGGHGACISPPTEDDQVGTSRYEQGAAPVHCGCRVGAYGWLDCATWHKAGVRWAGEWEISSEAMGLRAGAKRMWRLGTHESQESEPQSALSQHPEVMHSSLTPQATALVTLQLPA